MGLYCTNIYTAEVVFILKVVSVHMYYVSTSDVKSQTTGCPAPCSRQLWVSHSTKLFETTFRKTAQHICLHL